jgi:hypothetical protein
MRRFLGLMTLLVALLLARAVGASPPDVSESRRVVVVVVAPDAGELDVAGVRAGIGQELASDAVSPDDARASSARGRIDVSIDREARQLVVSYRGDSDEALVRRVDLPGDAEATLRAAVLLAGNLARDEAAELVAELRKPKPAAPPVSPPTPGPTPPPPSSVPSASDAWELAQSEYLRRLLAYYAARDRRVRLMTGWPALSVTFAGGAAALYLRIRGDSDAADSLTPLGLLALPAAILTVTPSAFERMSVDYEAHLPTPFPQWLRADMERRWKREAQSARRSRITFGVVGSVLGAASAGIGVLALEIEPRTTPNVIDDGLAIGVGIAAMGWGIVHLATESNLEWRLHEYERGLGHPIQPAEVGLRVTPVHAGLVAGLGGSF